MKPTMTLCSMMLIYRPLASAGPTHQSRDFVQARVDFAGLGRWINASSVVLFLKTSLREWYRPPLKDFIGRRCHSR
jgi:hypothetical protein